MFEQFCKAVEAAARQHRAIWNPPVPHVGHINRVRGIL